MIENKTINNSGGGVETQNNNSKWKTVMMYKKFKIVHGIKLNTIYDLNEILGTTFNNLGVFYTLTQFRNNDLVLKYRLDIEKEILPNNKIIFKNKYTEYNISGTLTCVFFEYGSDYYV